MTEARKIAHYGWIPDQPDQRDHLYAAPPKFLAALPPFIDLRAQCPAIYNQGALGSCTANAIAAAIEFDRKRQMLSDFVPSRLFIYYNERVIEGTVESDAGAQLRDGIKSVASDGVCPEPEWPYVVEKFRYKPPAKAYKDAKLDRAVSYQSLVQDLNQMKGCLASGYPFIFGFTVYPSFESEAVARTGQAVMPAWGERPIGGHAVIAVGYDDTNQKFLCRNSWGTEWGIKGYFTLPYAYLIQPGLLSQDFWTIRLVGQ
jgi:C1A family cysteine protease